jgi:hypothetical protein
MNESFTTSLREWRRAGREVEKAASIPRVSGIAERWDCVRQTYGLTATRLAEPVRCVT